MALSSGIICSGVQLRALAGILIENHEATLYNPTKDTRGLAEEFGVYPEVMDRFLNHFSPSRVKADQFKADTDIMLFVHIPKTAGMSVGRSLQGAFHEFRGVDWKDVMPSFRRATRSALYLQTRETKRQVIMGHYGWPELQLWRNHELPMKCGTILRDPVARLVSNYNYNCSDAHPDYVGFQQRFPTALSFAQQAQIDVQITQAIGFIDTFETALLKFITHYSFLGVTEYLSSSLAHLGRSHGLPNLQEYRENVGKIRPEPDIPAELHDLVERRSHNDRKLHQLLMRIYGSA